jgi:subtilisin family serine protease
MNRWIWTWAFLLTATSIFAASPHMAERVKYKNGPSFIYRLYLTDKKASPYSLNHPGRYLSRRSIERRKRQQLPIDSTDLPVNPRYMHQIEQKDVCIIGQSRWQNTVLVRLKDSTRIHQLEQLAFVASTKLVWIAPDSVTPTAQKTPYRDDFEERDSIGGLYYGKNDSQIRLLQGHRLHQIGLSGKDMMIAIIDGGFKNVNRIPAFQLIDICGYQDFVSPASPNIFAETDHGTKVLSTMAINTPYFYIGTAPKASYWLLRSEDQQTEQEVEEDYWTMAAEFADSVGCDLINSSLGYHEYDHPWMSHQLRHLDGHTAFVSRSASLLASKGIILVNSAGNSGMSPWKKIGVPSDADDILTVGAITADEPRHIAPFSSVGPSQDGRIKPDVVAIGAPAFLVNGRGVMIEDMGTSFSAPTVCGLAACLWEGLPEKSAIEIINLIRQNSDNYDHPDNIYGYGIPDFWRAYMKGRVKREE